MIQTKKGFTLIELIVVITIIAILATIGYIAFLGYASWARDTTRMSDLALINRALEYHKTKGHSLPTPDDMIPITLSGTLVAKQGNAGNKVLGLIGVSSGGKDPMDGEYYTYFLSGNKTQILGLLENQNGDITGYNNNQTYADYTDRYPYYKGEGIGVLLEENNIPIHRSDDVMLEGSFDIFNSAFAARNIKSIYSNISQPITPALTIGGQLSLNSIKRTTFDCPQNYIDVPGNSDLGQPDFCIGKYEVSTALNDDTLAYQTLSGVIPLTMMNNNVGGPDCRGNGEKYHIMTMMEWLTIARNIEGVDSNWSGGVTGSGYIYGGNNGNTITGIGTGLGVIATGTDGDIDHDNKRTLTLSNGEEIWDIIGNGWEVVKGLNLYGIESSLDNELRLLIGSAPSEVYKTALNQINIEGLASSSNYYGWDEIDDIEFKKLYGPQIGLNADQGLGKVREGANYIFFVGGDHFEAGVDTKENGLYSMLKLDTMNYANVTTRCAYSY